MAVLSKIKIPVSSLTIISIILIACLIVLSEYIPFVDPISLIIVIGGTFLSGFISFDTHSIIHALNKACHSKENHAFYITERVAKFSHFSKLLKKNGIISLESFAKNENDPLLKKGLHLVADGAPTEEIKRTLSTHISILKEQRKNSVEIIFYLASIAPAVGLIGTVTGLIYMLSQIHNTAELGSGMSMALLTTLYGAILSYLILQPLATRLEKQCKQEEMLEFLTLEGVLALSQGINPQIMLERLEAFAN